jgi:Tol biopolymer transport system component
MVDHMALNLALHSFQRLQESSVIQRVSTTSTGSQVSGHAIQASVSADGRYVLFGSDAGGFVAGDTNSSSDVFLKDLKTGELLLISRASDGTLANNQSLNAEFSGDGQSVIFESRASNLVVGDTNTVKDVFHTNLSTGAIARLTTALDGIEARGDSSKPSITSDGRYMVFSSFASNLVLNDTNSQRDIFLRDLVTGALTRVSVGRDGSQSNASSENATLSADGRYVVFESNATNLVGADTNGSTDIFYKDLVTEDVVRLSLSQSGTEANASSLNPRLSANGRYVVFESAASNLVAGDTNGKSDIFRKDLLTGEIARVSVKLDGSEVAGTSSGASISADGRYVLFESQAHDLVGAQADTFTGIYRKDMLTGAVIRISGAGLAANGNSSEAKFSADGRFVVFESTATNLVGGDANGASKDIIWVDADRIANGVAIREGRFVELSFGASASSIVTLAWGDGTVDVAHPTSGSASFSHAYATTGTKTVVATIQDGGQSRSLSYIVNLAAGTMVQNSAASDTIAGGASADRIVGDSAANHLLGHGGNDVLDGQAGADRMTGGVGDDVYVVDNASDQVIETGFEGIDLVFSSVNYALSAHVENVTATGSAALALTGNELNNAITGNMSRNILNGGASDDILAGGGDNDILIGGAGRDIFVFNTLGHKSRNKDKIETWAYREDTIRLDNDIFKKLTKTGKLHSKYFTLGAKAKDANDFIGVNKANGDVWYDANGNKAGGQVIFANIGAKKAVFASDFVVF